MNELIETTKVKQNVPDKPATHIQRSSKLEGWEAFKQWLQGASFSPEWLNAPLNYPVVGYFMAILLTMLSVPLTFLIMLANPAFAFAGAPTVLAILAVALLWGTGPAFLATLVGTLLLNYFILAPRFVFSLDAQHLLETGFFLLIGIVISLVTSSIEKARAKATLAHQVTLSQQEQLRQAQNKAAERASQLHKALAATLEMTQIMSQPSELTSEQIDTGCQDEAGIAPGVAQRLARLTADVIGWDRLSITLIDPETEEVRPLAAAGLSPEQEQRWRAEQGGQQARLGDWPDQAALRRLEAGEPIEIDLRHPSWNAVPNLPGAQTVLLVPMIIGEKFAGFITLDYDRADQHNSSDEQAIASAAAKMASAVLERERLVHQREELLAQEITLRRTNQQMADLIAMSHDAIFVRSPGGIVLSWNQGAEQLYGWTAEQMIGQDKHKMFKTRYPTTRQAMESWLEQHGRWEGRLIHRRSDGTDVIVDSRQVLVRDEAGQPTAILEINRDVSEVERLLREQAEAYARELALRETKARMDEFLGITSHELRTPLTTIKGNVQLARLRLTHLERRALQNTPAVKSELEEIYTMLNRAERQVNVQNRLIRDLMDISRIQVGKLELNKELCNLTTIVVDTVEDLRSTTPTRTIQLELQEHMTIPVIADSERISQVLSNFLTNALKYSPPDRAIHVSLELKERDALVAVRDEGPGLTPEERERVWERFYKVEGIKGQKGFSAGLGLGLHICRAVIEEHQGEAGVESSKGAGSTFWFSLPLAATALDE